ncbi:class III lanthipeptide [Microbacterium sp. HMWF026]|nr:class III lanthipeptide [Microbacterium sp. HMWF026]
MQAILTLQKLEASTDASAMVASTVSNHCIR